MSNKGLLTIIAVILLGIFALILVEVNNETPAEEFTRDFSEITGQFSNEIEDTTPN